MNDIVSNKTELENNVSSLIYTGYKHNKFLFDRGLGFLHEFLDEMRVWYSNNRINFKKTVALNENAGSLDIFSNAQVLSPNFVGFTINNTASFSFIESNRCFLFSYEHEFYERLNSLKYDFNSLDVDDILKFERKCGDIIQGINDSGFSIPQLSGNEKYLNFDIYNVDCDISSILDGVSEGKNKRVILDTFSLSNANMFLGFRKSNISRGNIKYIGVKNNEFVTKLEDGWLPNIRLLSNILSIYVTAGINIPLKDGVLDSLCAGRIDNYSLYQLNNYLSSPIPKVKDRKIPYVNSTLDYFTFYSDVLGRPPQTIKSDDSIDGFYVDKFKNSYYLPSVSNVDKFNEIVAHINNTEGYAPCLGVDYSFSGALFRDDVNKNLISHVDGVFNILDFSNYRNVRKNELYRFQRNVDIDRFINESDFTYIVPRFTNLILRNIETLDLYVFSSEVQGNYLPILDNCRLFIRKHLLVNDLEFPDRNIVDKSYYVTNRAYFLELEFSLAKCIKNMTTIIDKGIVVSEQGDNTKSFILNIFDLVLRAIRAIINVLDKVRYFGGIINTYAIKDLEPNYHLAFESEMYTGITFYTHSIFKGYMNPIFEFERIFISAIVSAGLDRSEVEDNIYRTKAKTGVHGTKSRNMLLESVRSLSDDELQEQFSSYSYKSNDVDNDVALSLPLGKGTKSSILTHQVNAFNQEYKVNRPLILDAQPGAGKTLMSVIMGIRRLIDGDISRLSVVCPQNLVKNYVQDIQQFFNGIVNVIPLTTKDVSRNRGIETLETLLKDSPPNTVCVISSSFLSKKVTYTVGVTKKGIYVHSEILKKYKWNDFVFLDEVQFLRNESSNLYGSAMNFIQGSKRVVLGSGTIIHRDLLDLAPIMNLINPYFMSKDDIILNYAKSKVGNKVVSWKDMAEENLLNLLKQDANVITSHKKDWANLLPVRFEQMHVVPMSEKHQELYDLLLDRTLESMLNSNVFQNDKDDDGELNPILGASLSRLEYFINSPKYLLSVIDTLDGFSESEIQNIKEKLNALIEFKHPKKDKLNEIIGHHLIHNEGKIFIGANYKESVKGIYDIIDDKFKPNVLLYEAKNSVELLSRFKTDSNLKILIGVRNSLTTGHNLQFISRIIRVDVPWTPGEIIQEDSRIERVDFSLIENEKEPNDIYIDWILANNTIDVTKATRIASRIVSATKFTGWNEFKDIPELPMFRLSLDGIRDTMDINTGNIDGVPVLEYSNALALVRDIQAKQVYVSRENKVSKLHTVDITDIPKDWKIIRTPLTADFLSSNQSDDGWELISNITDDNFYLENGDIVYTEDGLLPIKSYTGNLVKARLGNKFKSYPVSTVAIFSGATGLYDIKDKISSDNNLVLLDIGSNMQQGIESTDNNILEIALYPKITTHNGTITLVMSTVNDYLTPKMLRGLGFITPHSYYVTNTINSQKFLSGLIDMFQDNYKVSTQQINKLKNMLDFYLPTKERQILSGNSNYKLNNFFKLNRNNTIDGGVIMPYPMLINDKVHVLVDARVDKQPSVSTLLGNKVKGVQWELRNNDAFKYFSTPESCSNFILDMEKNGFVFPEKEYINNILDTHKLTIKD
jgi:hypothetical protein